jgi:hypothetical protein
MRSRGSGFFGWLLGAVVLCALGLLGFTAYQRLSPGAVVDLPSLSRDVHVVVSQVEGVGAVMHTIYLNREGATLVAGDDDSLHNASSIVRNTGKSAVHIPAYAGSAQAWSALATCIRSKFRPFDISVVDERPVSGDYIMAVVGGTPEDLGAIKDAHGTEEHTHDILGLAPFSGAPVANAVVLVFSRRSAERAVTTCETAGMEIAHAYGLDHERNCHDLMSYMTPCGARTFVNAVAHCGEESDRNCADNSATQNSFAKLLAAVGPAK